MKRKVLLTILLIVAVFSYGIMINDANDVYAASSKSKVTYNGVKNGKIYKTKRYVTISPKKSIKKVSITRNGKSYKDKKTYTVGKKVYNNKYNKFAFVKDGKYVVKTTLKNRKTSKVKFTVDTTKPTTNIKATTYAKTSKGIKITFKDATSGIKKATLNGKTVKSKKVVKNAGNYKLIITDKAGNKRTVSFKICAHNYRDATCTAPETCSKCGHSKGNMLGHSYIAATCITPEICDRCGETRGAKLEHSYIAGECEHCGDFSDAYCPKIFFSGDMSNMTSKKDVRNITFEYRSNEKTFDGTAKIKVQGTSSLAYSKKNYTVNFYEDSTYGNSYKVDVGWGNESEYCLKANWIDKTHSRNVVSAKIVGAAQAKYGVLNQAPNNGAIDGFPVEVYINDSFHGLYTMNIPKSAWMFAMNEDDPNHIVLCGESYFLSTYFKDLPTNLNEWSVEVGPEDNATLEKLQRLISFVKNSSDEEFVADFDKYLDLDSTLNYYILMEAGYMPDNHAKNMLLATYDGKVWYPSLYDLDTTWGVDWTGLVIYDYANAPLFERYSANSALWSRLEKLYNKELTQRYRELRSDILNKENIMKEFNDFYNTIPAEVLEREYNKWNSVESRMRGYDFKQIQEYLDYMLPVLDKKYGIES